MTFGLLADATNCAPQSSWLNQVQGNQGKERKGIVAGSFRELVEKGEYQFHDNYDDYYDHDGDDDDHDDDDDNDEDDNHHHHEKGE